MGHHLVQKIYQYHYYLVFWVFLSASQCILASFNDQKLNNERDSLIKEVNKYTTDTVRFTILENFFWQYGNTNLERVKTIGDLAFKEIENSHNLKALSDGYDIKGYILREEDKYDSSLICFEKALKYSEAVGYKFRMAWSNFHLGEIEYQIGDFTEALDNMKNAMKHFHDISYYSEIGKSIYYISDMYERLGIYDSVIAYNNYRLKLNIANSDTVSEIISDLNISRFYKDRNESVKSLEYLKNALKKAEDINNPKALTSVYQAIGDFFVEQKKNYVIALSYYNKVLEFAEKYNVRWLKTSLYNTIGDIYLDEGNYKSALDLNLKSLSLAKELKHRHSISNAYKSLGFIYKKLGDYPSAINCFKTCYTTGCNTCPLINFHVALVEIGNIYFKENNFEQSLFWYEKSLKLAEKFHSVKDISLSEFKIGNYYQKVGNTSKAEQYFSQSIKLAEDISDIALTKNIADTMSSFYTKLHNYVSAYNYIHLSKLMSDSLFNIDRQTDMTELQLKFEFEKIKKENEARQAISAVEIKRQKALKNYFVIFSLLVIGLGFAIYDGYRRKKKDNILLTNQKKQIEEKNLEIRKQVEKITSQKDEIENISNELHESDEMKLRFFSNISHEFRTPLTLILNPAENLLNTYDGNGETKKQLECIYKNAQRLHDLTNQIMDLQKLDAGKLQLNPEKADIIEYCLGIASSFESLCLKKRLTIRFSSNYISAVTLFDKDKIGKILINIITNSIKFCYDNSVIDIRIEILEDTVNFIVTDEGIGIAHEEIDNVFRRYYQVQTVNQSSGTGIGLAYVKELVKFMNGEVLIESVVKTGTKVTISIPVFDYTSKETSEFTIEIPNSGKQQNRNGFDITGFTGDDKNNNSVLLVEDNDELRAFIANLLKTEFSIHMAKDGKEGLLVAFNTIPDIIISDVIMPEMNGFELCKILKTDERTSHIPVILLTARDNAQSSIEGYLTGADDFIIKPFDNEQLKLKVKNIITTREAARNQYDFKSILSIDKLKIGQTDKIFIKKCITAIEKHIDNSGFSVDKLAEELGFSNRNLYRKIKALTNQTPAELIRIYRLNWARQLLQNSKLRIFEIAFAVGYEDANKFRQAFKKQFGMSPSESINKLTDPQS